MNQNPEAYTTMNYWDMPSLKLDLVDLFGAIQTKPGNSVANQTEPHAVSVADMSTQTVKVMKAKMKRDAKVAEKTEK